jgi:MFS family permease
MASLIGASRARGRPPLPIIFAVTVTGISVNTLITPVIPEVLDGLSASRSLAGLVLTAAAVPGIVLAPIIGVLADRYGRRELLVPLLVLYGLAGGLAGLAPSLWVLLVLRLLQGCGSAGLITLAVVLIGDYWDGNDRARLIGRNGAVLTVSLATLPLLGGGLTAVAGWRALFAVYPLALVTAGLVAVFLPEGRRQDVSVRGQLAQAWPVVRTPGVITALVTGVLIFVLIFGLLLTVMPLYVEQRFGLGPSFRGAITGLPAVTSTAAALMLGRLHAHFGWWRLLAGASVLFAVAFATVALAPALWVLMVGILLFGCGEGVTITTLQDVTSGAAPAESRGAVVAVFVGAARTGQALGPAVAGASLGLIGAVPTFLVGTGIAAALLPLFVARARARASPAPAGAATPPDGA